MTVYADEAFLLNGAVDYLLLICAAKLGGGRSRDCDCWQRLCSADCTRQRRCSHRWRFAGTSDEAGESCYHAADRLRRRPANAPHGPSVSGGSLRFAGAAVLAAQLFGTGVLVLPGGTFYAVSVLGLLLLAGLLYMLCYTIFSCTAQHGGEIRTMTLLYGGNRVPVRALHDTGCTLRDPMTGERVLVAEADALRALLPDASITRRACRPGGAAAAPENARPRFRRGF